MASYKSNIERSWTKSTLLLLGGGEKLSIHRESLRQPSVVPVCFPLDYKPKFKQLFLCKTLEDRQYFILIFYFILSFYFWRRKLYSVQIVQQWYRISVKIALLCNNSRARQFWDQAPHRIGSAALDGLLHSALERGLQCFHSSQEKEIFLIWWKACFPSQRGSWLIWTAVPSLGPDWSIITQMRTLNPHSLVQRHCSWLVRLELLCLVRAMQLPLDRESLSPIAWNFFIRPGTYKLQELLCKAWLTWQKHSSGRKVV